MADNQSIIGKGAILREKYQMLLLLKLMVELKLT